MAKNKKIEPRKIIRNQLTGEFEVLKPYSSDFYPHGRKYQEKGIATLYHQNSIHPSYQFTFEPPNLEQEIQSLVSAHIGDKSGLEQIA